MKVISEKSQRKREKESNQARKRTIRKNRKLLSYLLLSPSLSRKERISFLSTRRRRKRSSRQTLMMK